MTRRSLQIAGWITISSAFIAIPMAYLSIQLEGKADPVSVLILSVLQLFGTMLFIAIILYLKRFLNALYRFHDTNRLLDMMIIANSVAVSMVVSLLTFPHLKDFLSAVVVVIVIIQGILQIRFGYMLLKLRNDLGGLLKPFCFANMATGICLASVVLMPAGVLTSAVSDLMLATIFFNASRLAGKGVPDK